MAYRSRPRLGQTLMRRTSILVTAIAMLLEGLLGSATAEASAAARSEPVASRRIESRSALPAKRFVVDAQRTLRRLGYESGPIDGVVGPRTRGALTSYQRAEGLPPTGWLDPETMARLDIHERLFVAPEPPREVRAGRPASQPVSPGRDLRSPRARP